MRLNCMNRYWMDRNSYRSGVIEFYDFSKFKFPAGTFYPIGNHIGPVEKKKIILAIFVYAHFNRIPSG